MALNNSHFGICKFFVGPGEFSSVPVVSLTEFQSSKRKLDEIEAARHPVQSSEEQSHFFDGKMYNFIINKLRSITFKEERQV
jgi:alpha/beta superfamily hydrolase